MSALFKDGTIGGNINIAVVGLILLEDEQVGPKLFLSPAETLYMMLMFSFYY